MTTPTTPTPPPAPPARLALEDGSIFTGTAFGASGITQTAEVVFNTAMTGYQEALTDPSYTGQILVMTPPLVGNTGVNADDTESSRVQVAGFVIRELARLHSNFRADADLSTYLAQHNVLGIADIDTRALTRTLRTAGAMRGVISDDPNLTDEQLVDAARTAASMAGTNLVTSVACASESTWSESLGPWQPADLHASDAAPTIAAIDCGSKHNILRHFASRNINVTLIPHTFDPADLLARFKAGTIQGLFVSNGPGDPAAVTNTINNLRILLADPAAANLPVFGICLGHQLLALALGATTYKLKFGHRGANQPVLNLITGRVEITSQNHGFAVDPGSLTQAGAIPTHIHLNDKTLAGFCLENRPVFSVQYHPEASPGPHESGYLFDTFTAMLSTPEPFSRAIKRPVNAYASSETV